MKKLLTILFSFALVLALCVPAFAAAPDGGTTVEDTTQTETETTVEDDTGLGEYVGTTVYSLNPVTSADATGLKAVLLEFIGDYDAIVIEHAYESSNGYTNYIREVQCDYPWLCAAGLLVVMIFCLFKLGGSLLCRR